MMENAINIIKFINTIDKRQVLYVQNIDYCKETIHRIYKNVICKINYRTHHAEESSTLTLSEEEFNILSFYVDSDLDVLNYLEKFSITIGEIENYLNSLVGIYNPILRSINFDTVGENFVIKFLTNDEILTRTVSSSIFWKATQKHISLEDACKIVFRELKNDDMYYDAWKSNIAMSILDTKEQFLKEYELNEVPKELEISLANKAAKHFLNMLTHDRDS